MPRKRSKKQENPNLRLILGTLAGVGLLVFPEPSSSAAGLGILGATWGSHYFLGDGK